MDAQSVTAILTLAFSLGLLHALDADHVMAVSNLASARPTVRAGIMFCLRWALGHGTALLLIGLVVFALGVNLPAQWSAVAERLVGVMLVGLGIWVVYSIVRQKMTLSYHRHPGLPGHMHWHAPETNHSNDTYKNGTHNVEHSAVLVGMCHGVAGSAPLLALIPLTHTKSLAFVFAYLGLFGVGVFCSMLFFGGLLGACYQRLLGWSRRVFNLLRLGMGLGAIGYGGVMMFSAGSS